MPADLKWALAALAALGLAIALWLGSRASLPGAAYFLHDQQHYVRMAEGGGRPVEAPFVWRVLPAAIVRASGLPPESGFRALTLLSLTLIPPAIALLLSAAGASPAAAFTLGAAAALSPPVAGYLSWDVIRPDGVSLLLIVIAAWAAVRERPAIFVAALVALSLTKETWIIPAAFALLWSRASPRAFWKWAVAGTVASLIVAAALRLALPPSEPYSLLANARELYWPIDSRTVGRRLLLATAATWTVFTPVIAVALARRRREIRGRAVAIAVLIASAQVLVAIDTQRLVAAALPFVLLGCAWELDRLSLPARLVAGATLAFAQIPWLLASARIWEPPLRMLEILLVLCAAAFAAYAVALDGTRREVSAA